MSDEAWPLTRLLSAVIGSGPKSAADMTAEQASEAMHRIFDGTPDETTLGAFLLANRWKRNTPEELASFADVMIERSVDRVEPDVDPVDCGANYDGKRETVLLGVGAGMLAAASGTPIVTHSGDRVPTQEATTYKHVLDELGVETSLKPGESAAMVDETGFGFYYQPSFNPLVEGLLDRRRAMGVRTFLNTIETLANPANARIHLGSFYHLAFANKLADTVEASEAIGFERALLFQGLEGYDDIRPGHTTVAEWNGRAVSDFEIQTASYGMDLTEDDLQVDDVAVDSARLTESILFGDREGAVADAMVLNAAFRIYAGGDATTLEEGLGLARSALEEGRASSVLSDLRSFSP